MMRNLLRACWRPLASRAARAYVTGPGLSDALHVCRRLQRHGLTGTIGFWNGDGDGPDDVVKAYLDICAAVSVEALNCAVSVKAPAFRFDAGLLAEVLERSRRHRIRLQFDSLGPESTDRTFDMISRALPHTPRLGCTLPGRWRRSVDDADRAIELGLHVRVVKGQWEDQQGPIRDMRDAYLAVVDRLAGRARSVAVATHDPRLAREALALLQSTGTRCELELLYGLPARSAMRVAEAANVPVRLYVPYGSAWLPYALSYARKNPKVFWWVLRDLLAARRLAAV